MIVDSVDGGLHCVRSILVVLFFSFFGRMCDFINQNIHTVPHIILIIKIHILCESACEQPSLLLLLSLFACVKKANHRASTVSSLLALFLHDTLKYIISLECQSNEYFIL